MTTIRRQIRNLPWRAIRDLGFAIRATVAEKQVPEQDHIIAYEEPDNLANIHRSNHYREGWFLSWNYHGEDHNLCRAEYENIGQYTDYQHHTRLFRTDDGNTRIHTHFELDPIRHPRLHLKGVNQDISRGIAMEKDLLEENNIKYKIVEV